MNPETPSSKVTFLRFGVLCSGTKFQHWQMEAIRKLLGSGHQLVMLILDDRTPEELGKKSRFRKYFSRNMLFHLFDRFFFHPSEKKGEDLHPEMSAASILKCKVGKKGHSEFFSPADIDRIRSQNLDFILRFGFNIIRGEILESARYGIWSFHHDDERKYRGGPPCFWEIYFRDTVTGAILQRLTDRLDNGIILKKAYLRTLKQSYSHNLNQMLAVSSSWPVLVADEIIRNGYKAEPAEESYAPVYKIPGNWKMVIFLWRLLWNKLIYHYWDLFRPEAWNVGLVKYPIHQIALNQVTLRPEDIIWLRLFEKSNYLADPSGFMEENKLHILVEDYNYSKCRATISEIIWDPPRNSFSAPIRIIEGKKHLSYPFVVEHQKVIYCLPESYQDGNIGLYRRNFSEEAFIEDHVLLENVDAIDPTLFFYNNTWWLFFTSKEFSRSHLYIYHSDILLGRYEPHRKNPVKMDVRSSRPAGTPFVYDGSLYRPAQDCSHTYGGRVCVNKVIKLTPDEFDEIPTHFVGPVMGTRHSKGLHTLSSVGEYTLIDGKRFHFNWFYFVHRLRNKVRIPV